MASSPLPGTAPFGDTAATMTAAGTTSGTAATVTADHVLVTVVTTTARGVILRPLDAGKEAWIGNADSAEPCYVYPPSGCQFNGQTADLHFMLPAGKAVAFKFISATQILAVGG